MLVEQYNALTGVQRVVVECKDYASPLPRAVVAQVLQDYHPVTASAGADTLLLVTRNGIVANARAALDAVSARHLTERELFDAVLASEKLLRDAELAFEGDQLNEYYEPTFARDIGVELIAAHYDLYHGALADFGVELSRFDKAPLDYDIVCREWVSRGRMPAPKLTPVQAEVFSFILADRKRTTRAELSTIVARWLALPAGPTPFGLAVLGSYGTGKSSFAKALASAQAGRYRAGISERIPLLIELRHFGSHQSVEGLIADELSNRHALANGSFTVFQSLNAAGRFLLILDGFDEMKEGMSSDALTYNFAEINRLLIGEAKVVLCGRPTVFASQDEQRGVLGATHHEGRSSASRYIQVDIAPMSVSTVQRAIGRFVEARRAELGSTIDDRIAELRRELATDKSLQQLLARPVHYPMLVRVLPRWSTSLRSLTRAKLYQEFVSQTIAREMKPGRLPTIPADQRLRFAADLAVAMFEQGDSRSIRYGSIPDAIVLPHRRGTEALDITRRDLVKSCFLENKPPDILFFPHKSFGEYLAAWRFVDMAEAESPATDALEIRITPEIASFVDELMSVNGWHRILGNVHHNMRLVREFVRFLERMPASDNGLRAGLPIRLVSLRSALALDAAFTQLADAVHLLALPLACQLDLASGLEWMAKEAEPLAPAGHECLHVLAAQADDVAAIHAFRALTRCDAARVAALRRTHPERLAAWEQRGWSTGLPGHS